MPGGAAVSTFLLGMLRGQYPRTDALNDNVGTLHIIAEYIHWEGGHQCHVATRRAYVAGDRHWLCALKLLAGPFLTGSCLA